MTGFLHRMVDVGAVRLHIAEARPAHDVTDDVPLVVFLHGFPEYWWSWRHQLRAFAEAGLWAVAPDMRGYGESDKPRGVGSYEVELLADDIAGLVRALGRKTAIIVGHDWGAVVAWLFAQRHADMVLRLAILNVPHPMTMLRGFLRPRQLRKSWYILLFQLPGGIPERMIAKDDFAYLRRTFAADGFSPEEIESYVKAWRVPGAMTSGMSYYRAAIRRAVTGRVPKARRIECPVLVIWGDRDRYLGKELAEPPPRLVPNARVEHLPQATHWVQNAAPDRVNALLLAFATGDGRSME